MISRLLSLSICILFLLRVMEAFLKGDLIWFFGASLSFSYGCENCLINTWINLCLVFLIYNGQTHHDNEKLWIASANNFSPMSRRMISVYQYEILTYPYKQLKSQYIHCAFKAWKWNSWQLVGNLTILYKALRLFYIEYIYYNIYIYIASSLISSHERRSSKQEQRESHRRTGRRDAPRPS